MNTLFSIIIAVYNTEEYVAETIESVLAQTISPEAVEIILINDGSTDHSGDVCKEYASRYPEKIIYIEQQNQGVSVARNTGLEAARGEYVSFLDSDDLLAADVLQKVAEFYRKYKDQTDIVSIPMKFFGAMQGDHVLNDKYNTTRLIDLNKDFRVVQLSSSSAFIRRKTFGALRFEEGIRYGEDALLINQILLKKRKLGVVSDAVYWYRRRETGGSAIQTAIKNRDYYLPYINRVPLKLIKICEDAKITCPRFLQYMIVYDIHWRVHSEEPPHFLVQLGEDTLVENAIREIMSVIDDDIVLYHKHLSWKDKEYLLYLKTGGSISAKLNYIIDRKRQDVFSVYSQYVIGQISRRSIYPQSIRFDDSKVTISGLWAVDFDLEGLSLWVKVRIADGQETAFEAVMKDTSIADNVVWNHSLSSPLCFETLPFEICDGASVSFEVRVDSLKIGIPLVFGFFYSYMNVPEAYTLLGDYYYMKESGTSIVFRRASYKRLMAQEQKYIASIRALGNTSETEVSEIENLRWQAIEHFFSKHNQIWLFSDRIDLADDNGECLYDYCLEHKEEFSGIDMYFVLSHNSKQFERISSKSNILDYDSPESKELFLKADAIISSQANLTTYSVYGSNYDFVKGLQKHKKIFLQHGITKDDMSSWLHDWNKHLDLLFTASRYEYASFLNGDYGYSEKVIRLTGFPRFDRLIDKKEKIILFMPTWDSSLNKEDAPGHQIYNEDFKNTELYKEIQSVLSDSALITAMRKYGYRLVVKLHPNLEIQRKDFLYSKPVEIAGPDKTYRELLSEGALLITDYSSVQFDFAYMKKPLLYYQCRENHLKTGYYDYETMGFGEVVSSVSDLSKTLCEYLQGGCMMKEKYLERVNSFFAYTDRNNCERVITDIRSLLQ